MIRNAKGEGLGERGGDRDVKEETSSKYLVVQRTQPSNWPICINIESVKSVLIPGHRSRWNSRLCDYLVSSNRIWHGWCGWLISCWSGRFCGRLICRNGGQLVNKWQAPLRRLVLRLVDLFEKDLVWGVEGRGSGRMRYWRSVESGRGRRGVGLGCWWGTVCATCWFEIRRGGWWWSDV